MYTYIYVRVYVVTTHCTPIYHCCLAQGSGSRTQLLHYFCVGQLVPMLRAQAALVRNSQNLSPVVSWQSSTYSYFKLVAEQPRVLGKQRCWTKPHLVLGLLGRKLEQVSDFTFSIYQSRMIWQTGYALLRLGPSTRACVVLFYHKAVYRLHQQLQQMQQRRRRVSWTRWTRRRQHCRRLDHCQGMGTIHNLLHTVVFSHIVGKPQISKTKTLFTAGKLSWQG